MRVLLVENDSDLREILAEMLEADAHQVAQYADAGQVLDQTAASARPDVLVADVDLGSGDDGFGLADRVREQWPRLPVLFITGLWAGVPRVQSAGPSLMLQKPFTPDQLATAMRELVAEQGQPIPGM